MGGRPIETERLGCAERDDVDVGDFVHAGPLLAGIIRTVVFDGVGVEGRGTVGDRGFEFDVGDGEGGKG